MLLEDSATGIPAIQDLAFEFSTEISKASRVGVRIDIPTLHDVFLSAQNTVKFYNLKNDAVNHYKEAAHVSFWFQKFKPLRFVAPRDTLELFKYAVDNFKTVVYGDAARFDRDYESTNYDYVCAKEKPLNESVSLLIAKRLIRKAQRRAIKQAKPVHQAEMRAAVGATHEKFIVHFEELVKGVRYHSYSARGYATMIEMLFKVPNA